MRKFIIAFFISLFLSGCGRDATTAFVESIVGYSDYSTVEWNELRERYYRPNAADWGENIGNKFCKSFPKDIASEYWHLLQNARTDFHQKSLPLRAKASKNIVVALDNTEAMFDIVFVRCVSQEYYMRLFPEMYNETMKPAIDKLVNELNNKLL